MITSTVFFYAVAAFGFFASTTSATYKTGDDFFNALPSCIRKCNEADYKRVDDACASSSNNLQCVCDAMSAGASTANATAAACSLACSKDDQTDATEVIMNFAVDCLPYIYDDDLNNSTSVSVSATGSATLPSGSGTVSSGSISGTASTTRTTSTGLLTSTTPTGTTEATLAAQSTAAAAPLLMNPLFVIAAPAALVGLFM